MFSVVLAKTNGNDSSEDDSEFSDLKVSTLYNQKKYKKQDFHFNGKENSNQILQKDVKESDIWKAALCIQRFWRGYRTRNLNQEVVEAYKNIQTFRIQDYIMYELTFCLVT